MYKLIILCMAMAVAAAAPSGLVYSSPVLTPVVPVPHVVTSVVSPAVTSYSSYSNSVAHGTPVVTVPVYQAHSVPVIHPQPLTYAHAEPVFVV